MARKKFERFGFVRYALLDVEKDPSRQGFSGGPFDVVLAANVLHATADLARALGHVRSLLAPGGLLVLLEGTGRERVEDLTVGLTDGWWRFADRHLRPSYALLEPAKWLALLAELGFEDPVAAPGAHVERGQAILFARGPKASPAPGAWLVLADASGVGERVAEVTRPTMSSPRIRRWHSSGTGADGSSTAKPTSFRPTPRAA